MSLNRHTGLYAVPTHHLYGGNPVPAPRPTFNSNDFPDADSDEKQKEEVMKESKKGRSKSVGAEARRTPAASTPLIKITPVTTSSKTHSEKKQKRTGTSDKKRKRQVEEQPVIAAPPQRASANKGFFVGADMLKGVKSSVKSAGEVFDSSNPSTYTVELPAAKKSRRSKSSRQSYETLDFDRMAKETRAIDKKEKKEKKAERQSIGSSRQTRSPAPEPVPIPPSSPPIFSSLLKKTPVPLPQNAFSHTANANRVGRRDSRLLVQETPPSLLSLPAASPPDTSPIPFNLFNTTQTKQNRKADKAHASLSSSNHHKKSSTNPLTASNLTTYTTTTAPLNHDPKPRPIAASSAGSTTSVGTTPSIAAWFERVGKPYSAPFDPKQQKPTHLSRGKETHDESNITDFTALYTATERSINFSDEREYLAKHKLWREESVQYSSNSESAGLPCLGQKASGCNPKREKKMQTQTQAQAQSHHPSSAAPPSETKPQPAAGSETDTNAATLADAAQRGLSAETFLAYAVAARVPVPPGALEGMYKLFCPAYSTTHVDKYGGGQRSLSLFTVAGGDTSSPASLYTARLCIPPRSVLFGLDTFEVPPHASFRAVGVKTEEEGYGMQIVFLGNGYLLLRVDLRLLLSGKGGRVKGGGEGDGGADGEREREKEKQVEGKEDAENGAGKKRGRKRKEVDAKEKAKGESVVMEFLGVHEKAVMWEGEKEKSEEELERVGRKLFAKYDGEE
ncbi:hypothetical protein E8E13_006164 [Curvularia kusanoi]|uniref:Uncharacterized protein n=1 Tax=Curvularia kusanoi TaxID=90978 RepID=A0A9P4WDG1_CURKU|nr:hypothetical protein E8E13_006164 [Curvularia kusanoi]